MLDSFGISIGGLCIDPKCDQKLPNHAMALACRLGKFLALDSEKNRAIRFACHQAIALEPLDRIVDRGIGDPKAARQIHDSCVNEFCDQLDIIFGQLPLMRVANVPEPLGLPGRILLIVVGIRHSALLFTDRNFNPGNIAFGDWARAHGATGSAGRDTGHGVAVFPTPQARFQAMSDLALQKYHGGRTTADSLIAGPGGRTPGNHQAAANIARGMGIGPHDDLRLTDSGRMFSFQRSLAKQEGATNLLRQFTSGAFKSKPIAALEPQQSQAIEDQTQQQSRSTPRQA